MTNNFKKKHSFESRKKESSKIMTKYTDRIPIIVTKDPKSALKAMDKEKFLTPQDLTLGQFMYVIRKRINLDEGQSLFIFAKDSVMVPTASTLGSLYEEHKDEDGFLYLVYCSENVFG